MKTAAAALFLLLSSAEAFNTSPLNVRSPVTQSSTQLFGYLGQLEQLSSDGSPDGQDSNGVQNNGVNGTPANGAKQVLGATQVFNGAKVATMSNGASNGSSQTMDPAAKSSAELLQMQVALAEAEARLAALKSELPSHVTKKVSINLKMPSIAVPQTLKKETAKKVVFAAAVAKDETTVAAAAPPVVAPPSKSVVAAATVKEQLKAAKTAAKPVLKAVKPFAKAVKKAATKVTTSKVAATTKVVPKSNNGDYLSSLSSSSFKLKSTPKVSGGYLDSITKESLAARMKKILGHQSTAKLDPSTVLAYQFLRNVGGCVSISVGWFITSQKYGLSPLAPGLWKPTTLISVASFLLVNSLRPARVSLSTKISSFWSAMLDILQRRFKIDKPASRRVALAANVVVSAAILTTGIVMASQLSGVAIDKLAVEPVGRAAKIAARAAAKFAR